MFLNSISSRLPSPHCTNSWPSSVLVNSENWKQRWAWGGKKNRSARSIFVCHLSHYFHCSTSHCGLYSDEAAPSVDAAARCRSRHFPLMSAFEMPILCVILGKWSSLFSLGAAWVLWAKLVPPQCTYLVSSLTSDVSERMFILNRPGFQGVCSCLCMGCSILLIHWPLLSKKGNAQWHFILETVQIKWYKWLFCSVLHF